MSAAVTSSMTWWALRPLIAANMLRIIWASHPSDHGLLCSEVRPVDFLALGDFLRFRRFRLGDDRRVDVGEDVVLHVVAIDRRDDGPVAHRHDERGVVDEDHRVARAFSGGAIHTRVKAGEGGLAELDPAPAHTLDGVPRELDVARLLGENVRERGPAHLLLLRRARRRVERRGRDRPGWDERGVVRRLAHRTWVTEPESMPPTPSTVRVALPSPAMST